MGLHQKSIEVGVQNSDVDNKNIDSYIKNTDLSEMKRAAIHNTIKADLKNIGVDNWGVEVD